MDDGFVQSSLETCKMYSNKPIPNHQFPWCRRGYDNTFEKVKEEINDILPSWNKEEEEEGRILPSLNKEEEEEGHILPSLNKEEEKHNDNDNDNDNKKNVHENVKDVELHGVDDLDSDKFNVQTLKSERLVHNDIETDDFEDVVLNDTSINLQENESFQSKVEGQFSPQFVEDNGNVGLVDDSSSSTVESTSNFLSSQLDEVSLHVYTETKKNIDKTINDEEQNQHLTVSEHFETKEQTNPTEVRREQKENVHEVPTVKYESDASGRTNESEEF